MFSNIRCLFSEGFRIFFFSAGAIGLGVIALWTLNLLLPNAIFGLPGGQSLQVWHAHEMIFGYGTAAIGGFFLTAVPNWTKGKIAKPAFVTLLACLWGVGRLAMLFADVWPAPVVAVLDLLFIPVIAANIATQLIRNPKPQNLMFLGILGLIWVANLRVHLGWMGHDFGDVFAGLRGGLMGICAMIAILGGRVTPAFTRNAMRAAGVEQNLPVSRKPLELIGSASAIALALSVLLAAPSALTGTLALTAGVSQGVRLAGWRSIWTRKTPLLWSLHLGYGMLAIGYLAYGLASFGRGSEIGALHILAIGAVGGMTLAVMCRAALGHSGRALIAPRWMALSFTLMPVSSLLRWSATVPQGFENGLLLVSGFLWCLSLLIFTIWIFPIVSHPRIPKK